LCLQESEDLQINCLKLFGEQQKKMQRIMGPCACTGALWDYVSLLYLPLLGTGFLCVEGWFEAQMSGILTDVFAYISHFVCSYYFNYTGRPLRGPGIIGSFALSKKTGGHVTSAFGTPRRKWGLGIVQNWG